MRGKFEKEVKSALGMVIEINDADKFDIEPNKAFNVYIEHEHSQPPVGRCVVYKKNNNLYGDFYLYVDCNGLYPGVCYGMITNKKYKLYTIGLCKNPNEDGRIKPLNYWYERKPKKQHQSNIQNKKAVQKNGDDPHAIASP